LLKHIVRITMIFMRRKAIIYIRRSTNKQGNSLEIQKTLCLRFAEKHGYEVVNVFCETASGKDASRPELAKATELCLRDDFYFIALKVDRVARRISTIGNIIDSGIRLRIVQFGDTDVNKLILAVFAAMAETERDLISQRTKEALRMKKEQGVTLGNPKFHIARSLGRAKQQELASAHHADTRKMIKEIKSCGIVTLAGIADALNKRGHTTRRGKKFYASTVKRALMAA
jgi:DNA invertase Pin-like site-specific DNA recombinase